MGAATDGLSIGNRENREKLWRIASEIRRQASEKGIHVPRVVVPLGDEPLRARLHFGARIRVAKKRARSLDEARGIVVRADARAESREQPVRIHRERKDRRAALPGLDERVRESLPRRSVHENLRPGFNLAS